MSALSLFARNCPLVISLIFCLLSHAVQSSRCKCSRSDIKLSEDHDKAVVFSPNFPRPYCSKLNCKWRIEGSSNSSLVRFVSPKIDLRPHRDYIYFYENDDNKEPAYNCTGRTTNCEFVSSGPLLVIQFKTSGGVVDKYGFQGTFTLSDDDEFYSLSDDDRVNQASQKSTAWNFFVWIVLFFVVFFIVAAFLYWFCKKQRSDEDNRSPLLQKSPKREDSVHLSLNLPVDEHNE